VRFRTKQRPRGLLTRNLQRRLTLMVVSLGIVLIGASVAGRPSFWSGLFPDPPAAPDDSGASSSADDSARAAAELSTQVTTQTVLRPSLRMRLSPPSDDGPNRIPSDLLLSITDNVIGVPPSEARAFFVGLSLAERMTVTESRLLPPARYALLMDSPDYCRGKPWSVRGTLRRLTIEKPTHDSLGDRRLVDAWISLPDSGDSLVHVIALSKAESIEESLGYSEDAPEVQFAGYFFKREAYLVEDEFEGLAVAPLVLASQISRVPLPDTSTTRSDQLTPWLGWLALATCGGILIMVWMFAVSDANHRGQRTHELTRLPSSVSFTDVEIATPVEAIRRMQAAAEHAAGRADEYSLPDSSV